MTATGNSTYNASGAAYQQGGYTNYYFNSANHYFNGNTSITPANATISGYSWSISSDADVSASGTTYQGSITVNTLPETDMPATITVTVTFTGGTPTVDANTTLTGTKEIIIQGTKPSAPIISASGNTVTLSTEATGTTSIRYTLDGTDPTTSTGTVYSGAIDLSGSTTSPVTIKAITVRNGVASSVSEQVVTLTLPTPVITANATAGTATIACDVAGATIHYTTDGSEPTTSSSSYSSSISGLSPMTTIKAIAVKDGWNNSAVASETLIIPSGVSGDVVTIFDYEDHNWSYYQASGDLPTGYPTTYLSSPDPRNVKITYQGGSVNNASAVAISALDGEGQNKMIYYKTLEKSVPGMSGDYPYTVISNPFSKRPRTNGTTGTNGFWGFAGWKVISGGEYISEYGDNDVLPLDATIHFVNLPSGNTGNGAVVFEATWTAATVKTGTSAQSFTGGTYETNFWVLTGNATAAVTVPANSTMSARYPDGTVSTNTNFTRQITAGGNNAKVEFVNMNSTQNVDAAGYTFTMGRGIVNSGNGGELRGCSSNKACVHTVKVESGKYASLRNFTSGISSGNSVDQLMILGCDYDRARAVSTASYNEKLNVTGSMYVAGTSLDLQRASGALYVRCIIKSGNFLSSVAIDNNYTGAGGTQTYYFSVGNSNTQNAGRRYLVMEGGIIKGIAGGMDEDNDQNTGARAFDLRVRGTAQIDGVVYGAAEYAGARGIRTMVFTGGTINGWIAGGANGTQESGGALNGTSYLYFGGTARAVCANATANTVMNRAVGGNVFGAGCGYNNNSTAGQVSLGTNVVIADESIIDRGVYGGGSYGYTTSTSKIFILGGTVNGKDGGVNGTSYQSSITGGVFGGACQNQGGTVNIYMDGGLVKGGVFGGSNSTGTLSGSVTMQINGGQVGTSLETANIHGGGYGSATRVSQNVEITLGKSGQTAPGVTVYGDVYGGSALGYVNGTTATNTYHTYVTLNKGIINGSLYGGGLGDGSTAANVYGPVQVKVYGGSVRKTDANGANGSGGVYGCNNVNGAPQRAVSVDIYGTDPAPSAEEYALFAVYGGGNQASYSYGTPTVKVHNCDNSIEYVYGGGNAAHISNGNTDVTIYGGNKIGTVFGGGNGTVTAANVSGNTNVKIYGGTILHVFGGSNERGSVGGSINVTVNKQGDDDAEGSASACYMIVGEVYGGGNKAASDVGNITIGCTGTLTGDHNDHPDNIGVTLEGIGSVYGGANQANISGDITLTMNSGIVGNLFGGNNTSGTISGGIQVDVEKDNGATCASDWYLGNVFGGGNLAQYSIPNDKALAVNILNGTVSGNVYGGGKGLDSDHTKGQVTGNPVVTIGDNDNNHQVIISGDVYGGGDAGDVAGTPQVNIINKCNTSIANVYGGGNAADVDGTDVNIDGGTIGMVFGGGHGDKNSLPQKEANVNGAVAVDVTGGTISKVFGGSNSKGTISGDVAVNIAKGNTSCQMHITQVYGGGNEAAGNAGTINIGCTGDYETNHEGVVTVYGGANAADIGNNINLTIRGGHIDTVFGGNNTSGSISGTVTVNVNWDDALVCDKYLGNVFGGGNLATLGGSDTVNIKKGTVSYNVYGGGNQAGTGSSTVNMTGGTVMDGIYGGCNTSGTVSGAVNVNILGGTVGANADHAYGVFGGGFGSSTATGDAVTVTIGDGSTTPTIYGDIYGGSAEGNVNDDPAEITKVWLQSGTVNGDIYGGGFGDHNSNALVNGSVQVVIDGGTVVAGATSGGRVFGCNNAKGTPKGTVTVTVNATDATVVAPGTGAKTYALKGVYGGGNLAAYDPTTASDKCVQVIINGCATSIDTVYGGGNAAPVPQTDVTINGGDIRCVFAGGNGSSGTPANVGYNNKLDPTTANSYGVGTASVTIVGGTIVDVFGGSNAHGVIREGNSVSIAGGGSCPLVLTNVYGGGNEANGGSGTLTIDCTDGGLIDYVYGGANRADVDGDIELNIVGGRIEHVFGGNNASGDITGSITVNVEWDALKCDNNYLGYVYGGGNLAAYTAPTTGDYTGNYPIVNIKNGTVTHDVFGGGYGAGAIVTGNPVVTVGDATPGYNVLVLGNVFGGGNAAQVTGSTDVNVIHNAVVGSSSGTEGNIFGGGNAAVVTGDTKVYLGNRAKIYGNVYGGGNQGEVNGDTKVIVNSD